MFFHLKEIASTCLFAILTALSYPSAANAGMPLPIRPMAVENIGTFCCTKRILPLRIRKDGTITCSHASLSESTAGIEWPHLANW